MCKADSYVATSSSLAGPVAGSDDGHFETPQKIGALKIQQPCMHAPACSCIHMQLPWGCLLIKLYNYCTKHHRGQILKLEQLLHVLEVPMILCFIAGSIGGSTARMLSKNSVHGSSEDGRRLRDNLADLLLTGAVSGKRARSLYSDSQTHDPRETVELAKVADSSHAHRDLLRKLKKDKKWPGMFQATVPILNRATQEAEAGKIEIMLPHELVSAISTWNNHDDEFWKLENLRAACKQHLDNASKELGFAENDRILPIGIWHDGIPVKYDRSESLEVVTMNFPHVGGAWASMRIPLTALYKGHMVKNATLDGIMRVLTWSLVCLAEGVYPSHGPDGEALTGKRAKLAGKTLPKALLVEVRGDWSAFKSAFRLPGWAERESCCYRCSANKTNFMDTSSSAPWRQSPLTHWQLLANIYATEGSCPPLFGAPGFRTDIFAIDWLHCVDQGVAADFLGCLMHTILKEIPGSEKQTLAELFN